MTNTSIDTIWYTRCPVPTASAIAISNGWLDEEFATDSIAVRSLRASADRSVRESHFNHKQANSFRHGGNAPPIWSRSQGQDVVVVGLTWLPQYQSILSLPSTGVRSLADLKGKRLALPRRVNEKMDFWRVSALQGFLQALATVGLSENDVELVDLPIEEPYIGELTTSDTGALFDARQYASSARAETFALIRGEVDALYNYGSAGPALQAFLDATVVADLNHHPDRRVAINNGTPNVLTVSGELVRERPDLVARYLAQLLRAADWAREHKHEAQAIIAREVSVADEWVPYAFGDDVHACLAPTLDPELVQALEVRKDFMLRHGFIQRDFSIDDWIKPEPLAEAKRMVEQSQRSQATT
ncbi:ABC transporter substrate-binding protein [Achromobacter kerstersii]|uniref:2'-hydroxybiphenyl-2-sulfinate desulfinase n=1 Tax=Achromobacter kerstersii TaxID=1353890 RepID=A0A6S6Z9Q7_9BURK|nr:ABC transporter substrate-binding protein [Achromobacter kerstersii]CAB3665009.1 2'-hydroxybiphenyl-2-sulfinate desulfinase [Achromobacter kerstersii]